MQVNHRINTKFNVCSYLRKKMLEDEEISSYVSSRIYPILAPEDTRGDYIVYVRDRYSIDRSKMGIYNQNCIVFISCVSTSYDRSQQIATSIFNCLDGIVSVKEDNLQIDSIQMIDSTEDYAGDVYIQTLEFLIK